MTSIDGCGASGSGPPKAARSFSSSTGRATGRVGNRSRKSFASSAVRSRSARRSSMAGRVRGRHSRAMIRAMSVLSDRDIRAAIEAGEIVIRPYDPQDLQPSSVDLHLDRRFRVFRNNRYPYIDVRNPQPDLTELLTIENDEPFVLHPGEFVLGQTLEWTELPNDLVAR